MATDTATLDLTATSWSPIPEGFGAMTLQLLDDHIIVLFCIASAERTPALGELEGLLAPSHIDLTTLKPGDAIYLRARAGVGRVRLLLHDADEQVPLHAPSPFTASIDRDRPEGHFFVR